MKNTDDIPSAEDMEMSGEYDDYSSMMISFAKMHVQKALEEACKPYQTARSKNTELTRS